MHVPVFYKCAVRILRQTKRKTLTLFYFRLCAHSGCSADMRQSSGGFSREDKRQNSLRLQDDTASGKKKGLICFLFFFNILDYWLDTMCVSALERCWPTPSV